MNRAQAIINLCEALTTKQADDKFLFGACLSFAIALQQRIGGTLKTLKRNGTSLHVFLEFAGKTYDVRGIRSFKAMARTVIGSTNNVEVFDYAPADRVKAAKEQDIQKALLYVSENPHLFGV